MSSIDLKSHRKEFSISDDLSTCGLKRGISKLWELMIIGPCRIVLSCQIWFCIFTMQKCDNKNEYYYSYGIDYVFVDLDSYNIY